MALLEDCRALLTKLQDEGHLDAATIVRDVTKISSKAVADLKPSFLGAGFPCQDLCNAGARRGFKGNRSRLLSVSSVRSWDFCISPWGILKASLAEI